MTVAQNIYNNPDFLARYAQLPRSLHGLDGGPEWPSLRRMLPPVAGARVLDLGCGFGWFCRWANEQGAASVLGIDLSQKMLERAAAEASRHGSSIGVTTLMTSARRSARSSWSTAHWHFTTSTTSLRCSTGCMTCSLPMAPSCSQWSIRSLPLPLSRSSQITTMATESGLSTATSTKAREQHTGSSTASSYNTARPQRT